MTVSSAQGAEGSGDHQSDGTRGGIQDSSARRQDAGGGRSDSAPSDDPAAARVTIDLLHLAEDSADGIAVFDSAGTYLFVNSEAERVLGAPRAHLLGRSAWDVSPELAETSYPFVHHLRRAAEGRAASSFDAFSPALGRWLQVRFVPCSAHRTVSGDEHGVTVYFRDVTERHEAEGARDHLTRERAESEGRFRTVADSAPVLIWTSGADGQYDWFNRPWLEFTGREMEQEVGYGWAEGVHPEDRDRCLATYNAAFDLCQPFTLEYRLRRHDGEWRWLLDSGVPRYAERGLAGAGDGREFLGYIGSCVDLTDRKLAEERAAALLAERTELAARQAELLAQQRAFLKDVLLATTDGVLRLCDTESDLPPVPSDLPVPVPLDAASSLRQLRREVEQVAAQCDLPEDRISDLLTASSEAAMNVVAHAGGRGGEGRASCDSRAGVVRVRVSDAGPGIPLARLHRAVLERGFTTANSLGHGFWLMLKTADRIHLWTEEGRGTTVVIEEWRTQPTPEWAER